MNACLIAALLSLASLVSTADSHATPSEELHRPDLNESFEQAVPYNLLRGLFNQALSTLHEYLEVEATLPGGGQTHQQAGEFRLKLFPQGKSQSQEHMTAEGSFRLSPDADEQEFTLRFKSSKPSQRSVPPSGDIL